MAYLRYNNATTYVAAVAEVAVDRRSGEIRVERVCVAHDCGQMVNPDGVANQVEGGVIQTVSRTLMEQVNWDRNKVTSVDWASLSDYAPHAGAEGRGHADRPARNAAVGRGRADGLRDPGGDRQRGVRRDGRAHALAPVHAGQGEGRDGGDATDLGEARQQFRRR